MLSLGLDSHMDRLESGPDRGGIRRRKEGRGRRNGGGEGGRRLRSRGGGRDAGGKSRGSEESREEQRSR